MSEIICCQRRQQILLHVALMHMKFNVRGISKIWNIKKHRNWILNKSSWLHRGKRSLPQVACWLIWQGHGLPTLIQYYPNSRAPWTWQKEVSKVKPSYDMPHCSGPTTSSSNCPLTATKQGPCQRMLKGHWSVEKQLLIYVWTFFICEMDPFSTRILMEECNWQQEI